PDELRLALLDERRHAFLGVLAREELAELVRLALEVLDVVALERVVRRALDRGERERRLRGEQLSNLARLVDSRVVHRVHKADPQRLRGTDDAARQDQVLRDAEAADPRQALGPAPAGDDPEVDLGLAELRAGRRVAQVARERELAAAAEREPVDRGDRRLRHG